MAPEIITVTLMINQKAKAPYRDLLSLRGPKGNARLNTDTTAIQTHHFFSLLFIKHLILSKSFIDQNRTKKPDSLSPSSTLSNIPSLEASTVWR